MSATFTMPSLGADMGAGTLAHWHRAPGDAVRRGDLIAAVETDKGVIDVECFADGVIGELLVAEGDEVPVGTPLATILTEAGQALAPDPIAAPAAVAAPPVAVAAPPVAVAPLPVAAAAAHASPLALRVAEARGVDLDVVPGSGPHGRVLLRDVEAATGTSATARPAVRSTPRARELATSAGLDIAVIHGTGPGGRVMRRDVEAAIAPAPAAPEDPGTRMRRAIAAAMSRSNREIPHYYVGETVDLGALSAWLAAENERRPLTERLLAGTAFVKAVALALRDHPDFNAVWEDGRVLRRERIHVGVAISLRGGGLVAPALHDADQRSLDELMTAFRDLVARARRGGLRSSELADPTITVTSLGEGGSEETYGVIFPPQVALVGFGRIVERPWIDDGAVVGRTTVRLTLSADHRVTDGHAGSAFLHTINQRLQEPDAL